MVVVSLSGRRRFFTGIGSSPVSGRTGVAGSAGSPLDPDLRALVVLLARENPRWGYQRIVGELRGVGFFVSVGSVRNLLRRHGLGPAPQRSEATTWRAFLRAHADTLIASDFFTVDTVFFQRLYVLFFIEIGVCNLSAEQLEEAMSVVSIVSVQNRFSPFHQEDRAMLDHCAEHSIAYLAHSPLGGGPAPHGGRAASLADTFPGATAMAQRQNVSVYRLALAWLLTLSPTIIPSCGAGRPESIRDSTQAVEMVLTEDELAGLDF